MVCKDNVVMMVETLMTANPIKATRIFYSLSLVVNNQPVPTEMAVQPDKL